MRAPDHQGARARMRFDMVPSEMRRRDAWVGFRFVFEPGKTKPRKFPYRLDNPSQHAHCDKPQTWGSFEQAVAAMDAGVFDAIGYCFSDDDPFTGVDLDDEHMSESEMRLIIYSLDSYAERSVSGVGYHVLIAGSLNGDKGKHAAGLEVYDSARFFIVTGDHVEGTPATIEPRQTELDALLTEYLPEPEMLEPVRAPSVPLGLDDHQLLERMFACKNGAAIEALWNGSLNGNGDDHSSADLALVGHLRFWTQADAPRMDALFRQSGLMRPKWDERRGDRTYGAMTIAEALPGAIYDPPTPRAPKPAAAAPVVSAAPVVAVAPAVAVVPAPEHPLPFALEVTTAAAFCAQPDDSSGEELLGAFVIRGNRVVIGGHTGEGKTTLTLAIASAIVESKELLGFIGSGTGRILVLDAEQGKKSIKRRLREADLDNRDDVDVIRVPDGLELDSDPEHIAAVERVLAAGNYSVVAVDPLYKLHSGDSNAEREAVNLMRRFDDWRERFNFALLLPVHCRKPIPGMKFSIHDIFGSSAYVRGAEVVVGVQRLRDGYSKLHWLKDRDGDLPIGASWGMLFSRDDGYRRDPSDGKKETTADKMRDILAADPTLTNAQLEAALKVTERTIRRARNDLEKQHQDTLLDGDNDE